MVNEKMPPYFILCSWKRSIVSPFVVNIEIEIGLVSQMGVKQGVSLEQGVKYVQS